MALVPALLAIGPRRWPFLVRVGATGLAAEAAVRILPLDVAARLAGARLLLDGTVVTRDAWPELTDTERERCALALRVLGRRPFQSTCLRRSLVLAALLRRWRPALRVGVAKTAGAVAAHAWLEIDGATLDPEAVAYRGLAPVSRDPLAGTA